MFRTKILDILLAKMNAFIRLPIYNEYPHFINEISKNFDKVKSDWEILKKSMDAIKPIDDISSAQYMLNKSKRWDASIIYAFGHKNHKVIQSLGYLSEFIDLYSKDITLVMFSILKPGMHLESHTGNNYHVLRSQLVIENPEYEETGLLVDGAKIELKQRERLVFDDTYEHEAWNNSTSDRVVLIIDFVKPFPVGFNWINRMLLNKFSKSEYVKQVISNW